MIFADKLLLDSLLQNDLLTINNQSHKRTWGYYYEQYHKAFLVFLEIAKQKLYQTNRKFMPFMFIMRHSLELFLTEKISKTMTTWEQYGTTHNLEKLYQFANFNDQEFLKHLDCLNCNSEGDCWRYVSDRNESSYFKERKEIHAFDACNYYCSFLDNDASFTNASADKKLQWELTFHTTDYHSLGIIGTQYDFAIKDILLAIKEKISINDIYLPLLFLLRHCLELKLKASIIELGDVVEEQDYKVNNTHKVNYLYAVFSEEIVEEIEKHCKSFYIRANRCSSIYNETFALKGWKTEEINGIEFELNFILVEKWKGKAYRLVVQRQKRMDGVQDFWEGEYTYRCILTNDYESSAREIVEFYNLRGGKERIFDDMNNGFGWDRLPKSFMAENTVFLLLTALIRNFYKAIIQRPDVKKFGLNATSRIKAFVFRFISVPAKWIRTSRRYVLNIYTYTNAYADVFQTDFGNAYNLWE